jgi:DNA-binding SARP family transcriptional activator
MPDVRLYLLGGFELFVDGCRIRALQPAAQRLIALVALARRGVERDFAALQLWPDSTEERARASLRSSLWRIRRLPVALIERSSSRLRLADDVWLDVRNGLTDLEEAGQGLADAMPFHSLFADLLPDWYDDWLMIEREKMRQLTLRGLDSRARAALDRGLPAEAIQVALTAMAIDPLRESSCRLVIEAHLSEGNKHEARRTVEDYRRRLGLETAGAVVLAATG